LLTTPSRSPADCVHRVPVAEAADARFCCRWAQTALANEAAARIPVTREACQVCCRHAPPQNGQPNPVVASLIYAAAMRLLRERPLGDPSRIAIIEAQQLAGRHLQSASAGAVVQASAPLSVCNGSSAGARPRQRNHTSRQTPMIGLVGRNSWQGLGYQNRDIARNVRPAKWLIPAADHRYHTLLDSEIQSDLQYAGLDMSLDQMRAWCRGLAAVLFVENPGFSQLPGVARSLGIQVICVPNWEWLDPGLPWLADVDVMVCPTRFTLRYLTQWKERFSFPWDLRYIQWPLDAQRFPFRQRHRCERFIFVNGLGGCLARRDDEGGTYRRKGLELLCAAARLVPRIPFIVYSQSGDLPALPRNVELRAAPTNNAWIYQDGDVCVQPSHWEGLGLPLLECQAAGMPLITTGAAPMDEHNPIGVIPVKRHEPVWLSASRCIPSQVMAPRDLAAALASVYSTNISAASLSARKFIVSEHGWPAAKEAFAAIVSG